MRPRILTFDFFGTVIDWRTGLTEDLRARGRELTTPEFDKIVDLQGEIEQKGYQLYAGIVAESLKAVLGLDAPTCAKIGARAGDWPLFADSRDALARLQNTVPCVAMTNSDRAHGEQIRQRLASPLLDWICAEEVRVYKPNPEFWHLVARKHKLKMDRYWWHVSAYGDYDLEAARSLGLTCVFIDRPHAVAGPTDFRFADLKGLADHLAP